MVTLVIVKNPFSPQDGREVKYIEPQGTVADLLEEYSMPGVDLQATVNGYSCDDKKLNDEDFVVIYPVVEKGGKSGGKSILGIVAAIALSVVSFGVGGLASGAGMWGAGMGAWTTMGYIAAAAVMFIGSSLMGRFMGQSVDLGSYDANNEPTYSWGGVTTMEGQNNAISLTYGKVKSGGQTIGKFVSSENDDEYLNWLVACGEGELTITDIKLNDNPITNYADVSCEIRSGTNDQSVVPYFNDTYFTKNLSYHMTTAGTWYTDTAQGTATDGLIFKIELPNGLFHGTNEGKQESSYVDIQMDYKLSSANSWTTLQTARITGDSTKAIRKEYRVDNITSGTYNVRVKVVAFQHNDATRDVHEIYWTGITSIVYDDFIYPCQALIGIRAKATDQLNGNPALTFMKERDSVYVYNPHADAYEEQDATNPAWAAYDFIHQARLLKNINATPPQDEDEEDTTYEIEVRGAAKELMRYDDFAAWAEFCEDKEYYINIEINSVGEVLEVANQKIAPIGHGLVVRFGTKYGCIYDHVQTPVQMFGMGNIISGSFGEEFLKVSDRANCVEITFTNKDAGYERDVLTIYGDTYDTDGYTKTAQMTFDGITDYEQAYREGKYQLYANRYLLRTVSFEASIDAIACTVGDVVLVSHDVPKWANSGRIDKASAGIIDVEPNGKVTFNGADSNYLLPVPNTIVYGLDENSAEAYSKDVPSVSIADMTKLGGRTIVWNQLVDTNTTSVTLISGRKYYIQKGDDVSIVEGDGTAITVASGNMVCDLTQMFGIGNEPTTVKDFVTMFPNNMTTYNAGTFVDGGVTTVKSVGKNLADPSTFFDDTISQAVWVENEDGGYWKFLMSNIYSNFRSDMSTNKSSVFTQDYVTLSCDVRIDPNNEYNPANPPRFSLGFADAFNGGWINREAGLAITDEWQHITVTAVNTGKCKLASTYSNNVRINIRNLQIEASETETPYEAYQVKTYTVPSAITALEGYGWSAGTAYNYIDYERKKFVKCVDRVDLGTLSWAYTESYGTRFYSTSIHSYIKPNQGGKNAVGNLLIADYLTITYNNINKGTYDKVIALGASNASISAQYNIQLRDTSVNTADPAVFKAAMSGKYLYYELKTPVETDISQYLDSVCMLPCELESGWENNSYILQWRSADDTLHSKACTVVSSADGWTKVTVADSPQENDVFDIAIATVGSKPFVVKSITRSQDFTRRITCLEYDERIYNEQYDIPTIDYSTWYGTPQNVTGLIATITQTKNAFGGSIGRLNCSWNVPDSGGTYTVLLSTDGNTWKIAKSNIAENYCEIDVLPNTTYYVKVITVLGVNQSTGTVSSAIYPTGDGTLPTVTNLTGYTRYRGVKNGEERYEIHLTWTPPLLNNYQSCDVWYKTNNAQVADLTMTQGVAVNQLGFQNQWKFAGNGYADFTMSDVTTGDTYKFAVVTRDSLGNTNLISNSPYVNVTATAKTETPNTPDAFSVVFNNDNCTASWKEVSNADIQFYEIRNNTSVGVEDDHLLVRTRGTSVAVPLTTRTGTLYLYAKSVLGKYSTPAVLEYVKVAPPKPGSPQLTAKLGGFSIETSSIPTGCNGMQIYIDGDSVQSVWTENSVYSYMCGAGIYDVKIAYTDFFGEGELSNASRIAVEVLVDETMLADMAVSKEKLDNTMQGVVADAVQSVEDIKRIDETLLDVDGNIAALQTQADGIETELNKNPAQSTYASIQSLKSTTDTIISDATTNYNTLNGLISANTTAIQQTDGAVTTLANRTTTNETNISALQVQANSISSTVSSNKSAQDTWNSNQSSWNTTTTSNITQNATSITGVITKLNSAPNASGQYSSITQLKASVDGLSSQLTDIIEDMQDGMSGDIAVLSSQVTQNTDNITAIVSNLNSSASGNTYSAISSLSVRADNISSTVSTNKSTQDAINAGTSSSGLKTMITNNTTSINQNASDITTLAGRVTTTENQLGGTTTSGLKTAITQNASDITTLASRVTTTENQLGGTTSSALKTAINQNASAITAVANRTTATETDIATLQVNYNGLSSTVASNKNNQDDVNDSMQSNITQNANAITAVVNNLSDYDDATTEYSAFSTMAGNISAVSSRVTTNATNIAAVDLKADGISSTVSANKTAQDKVNAGTTSSGLLTKINQNADSISAVVSNLNDSTAARNYTAIQVMQDGIATKVTQNDVQSFLSQTAQGFYIKGDIIKIDGTVTIGNNVITSSMINSSAVTAAKIASNAVTSAKIKAGAVTADKLTIGSSSGARLALTNNLLCVYDANGVLRVRLGVWN